MLVIYCLDNPKFQNPNKILPELDLLFSFNLPMEGVLSKELDWQLLFIALANTIRHGSLTFTGQSKENSKRCAARMLCEEFELRVAE